MFDGRERKEMMKEAVNKVKENIEVEIVLCSICKINEVQFSKYSCIKIDNVDTAIGEHVCDKCFYDVSKVLEDVESDWAENA